MFFLFVIILTLFTSCVRKADWEVKVEIDPRLRTDRVALEDYLIERLKPVMSTISAKNIAELKQKGNIVEFKILSLKLDSSTEARLYSALHTNGKGLEFWETYDNEELGPQLVKLNDTLGKIGEKRPKEKVTEPVSAPIDSSILSLTERMALRKKQEEQKNLEIAKDHPLTRIFFLAIYQNPGVEYSYLPGSKIGTVSISDTFRLRQLLDSGIYMGLLPEKLRFIYKPVEYEKRKFMEVYALKYSSRGTAAIRGDIIESANATKDMSYENIVINMKFRPPYIQSWRNLTRRMAPGDGRKGRCIAILFDDELLSAPLVNGEIEGGYVQITGNFAIEEADEIAAKLQARYYPYNCRVISCKQMNPLK